MVSGERNRNINGRRRYSRAKHSSGLREKGPSARSSRKSIAAQEFPLSLIIVISFIFRIPYAPHRLRDGQPSGVRPPPGRMEQHLALGPARSGPHTAGWRILKINYFDGCILNLLAFGN